MAHEVDTMMYVGATPWHGLGTYVGDEPVTTEIAYEMAGLDWTVEKHKVFTQPHLDWSEPEIELPDYRAIVRSDTKGILGIVGKSYHPFQNLDMARFADDLVQDGSMRIHTAGSLREGAKVWMLGKVGTTEIVPEDKVDHYLFLYNGHDGKTALRCLFTTVRVVCANTARAALGNAKGDGISIRHTKNMEFKVDEARRVLGIGREAFAESDGFMRQLADTPMPTSDWIDFCLTLFPNPVVDESGDFSKRAMTIAEKSRRTITSLYHDGRGARIPGVQGTAWGAYNALTEFAGYHRKTRGNQRFESLMMGSGADFVRKGTDILRSLV
jgi:phage/plasmid-like protein (TIGR03299 family)